MIVRWGQGDVWVCEKCHCGPVKAKNEAFVVNINDELHSICRACLKNEIIDNWDSLTDDGTLPNRILGGVMLEIFSEEWS